MKIIFTIGIFLLLSGNLLSQEGSFASSKENRVIFDAGGLPECIFNNMIGDGARSRNEKMLHFK